MESKEYLNKNTVSYYESHSFENALTEEGEYIDVDYVEEYAKLYHKEKVSELNKDVETKSIPFEIKFAFNEDVDESKASVRLTSKGNISIEWHDCIDSVRNKLSINKEGLFKLEQMELVLASVKKHLLENIK